MNTRLKIGDRVRWSGHFRKNKEGIENGVILSALKKERLKPSYDSLTFNIETFLDKYKHPPSYLRGVGKIKKVWYNKDIKKHLIELNNGKWFFMDDTQIRIV